MDIVVTLDELETGDLNVLVGMCVLDWVLSGSGQNGAEEGSGNREELHCQSSPAVIRLKDGVMVISSVKRYWPVKYSDSLNPYV